MSSIEIVRGYLRAALQANNWNGAQEAVHKAYDALSDYARRERGNPVTTLERNQVMRDKLHEARRVEGYERTGFNWNRRKNLIGEVITMLSQDMDTERKPMDDRLREFQLQIERQAALITRLQDHIDEKNREIKSLKDNCQKGSLVIADLQAANERHCKKIVELQEKVDHPLFSAHFDKTEARIIKWMTGTVHVDWDKIEKDAKHAFLYGGRQAGKTYGTVTGRWPAADLGTHGSDSYCYMYGPDCSFFTVKPLMLSMRTGGFYQTRDGRTVGPLAPQNREQWPWYIEGEGSFDSLGRFWGDKQDPKDLMRILYVETPIRRDYPMHDLATAKRSYTRAYREWLCAMSNVEELRARQILNSICDRWPSLRP